MLYYDASDDVEYDGGDGDQVDNDGGDDEEELFFCCGTLEIKRQTALFAILCILMDVDMLKIYQDIQKWKWSLHTNTYFSRMMFIFDKMDLKEKEILGSSLRNPSL